MGHPSLHSMQAFRRVVELHSFTAAANSLDMSGGAVSKLVTQLEQEVGARLLNRTTRSVNLTEAGSGFYEAAIRIANQLPDPRLVARPLGHVLRVLVASPRYLERAAPIETPEDLQSHDCLIYTQTATPNQWPLTIHGLVGHQRHIAQKVRLFLDFVQGQLAAAPS